MPRQVSQSSSAKAQREFRRRMLERGLVPRQIYVLPRHKATVDALEQALRQPVLPPALISLTQEHLNPMTIAWTPHTLHLALLDRHKTARWNPQFRNAEVPTLSLSLPDHGDLPVHVGVVGQQVMVSAVLFPASQVRDRAALNEAALRLGPMSVFTAVGLQTIGGEEVYIAYGQLSSLSAVDTIVEEIEALGNNALEFVRVFASSSLIGA